MHDSGLTRMEIGDRWLGVGGQQFHGGRGLEGESFPRVHMVEPHGFTSHAVPGGIATAVQARGRRDSVYALGGANPSLVPALPLGGTAIYDHLGNIVSLVQSELRIVHSTKVTIQAAEIVLDGLVKIGGADADRPASAQGTLDSAGHAEQSNFATRVLLK